nr:sialyltransferase-like protein 1 [Ipomoea batatas]
MAAAKVSIFSHDGTPIPSTRRRARKLERTRILPLNFPHSYCTTRFCVSQALNADLVYTKSTRSRTRPQEAADAELDAISVLNHRIRRDLAKRDQLSITRPVMDADEADKYLQLVKEQQQRGLQKLKAGRARAVDTATPSTKYQVFSYKVDPYTLRSGDYVVHKKVGVGRFVGIKFDVSKDSSIPIEYVFIEYSDGMAKLPVKQASRMLYRYNLPNESKKPQALSKLSDPSAWERRRLKGKIAVQKMVVDLMELYLHRLKQKRPLYPKTAALAEFASQFPYEPTPDQKQAFLDVERDLTERENPMDRLICGDVGFGKTEVALRAIFCVVSAAKQVMVLAPTIVLAKQHFDVISDRFSRYPHITVGLLSRFQTKSEKEEYLHMIKHGHLDIIVGTHALLGSRVEYNKLGLLVVDEEQYRNMTTVLTREYLDARPDGWLDYAAKRIAQLGADKCYNRTLCEEHLNIILPAQPPFHPRQFRTCAVVGNSGDLLKTEFGPEIDSHDAVIRDNEAPVNEKYAKYVGLKRDFRLVVRGAARNMITILNGSDDEVLIIKSLTHRDFNTMIKRIPNPVYLFQGIVLRRGAKGTGMKSIELALSMCDIVDIYGFTVDPGYTEWTRYFSTPRKGHNPLQGRAYYQLLECLGVIRIHSPMRAQRKQDWSDVPSREMINRAQKAALQLKRSAVDQVGGLGQFVNCKVWGNAGQYGSGPISGSPDMTDVRKNSKYSKWEVVPFKNLREETRQHFIQMEGVSMYKMDGNKLDDLVCVKHPLKSEAESLKKIIRNNLEELLMLSRLGNFLKSLRVGDLLELGARLENVVLLSLLPLLPLLPLLYLVLPYLLFQFVYSLLVRLLYLLLLHPLLQRLPLPAHLHCRRPVRSRLLPLPP